MASGKKTLRATGRAPVLPPFRRPGGCRRILFFKGLGVSKVEQMFGLYFFSSIVIVSLLISCYTDYLQKKALG